MLDSNMTIRSLIEQYPELKDSFSAAGLGRLVEGEVFERTGAYLTLESGLRSVGKDPQVFVKSLHDRLDAGSRAIVNLPEQPGRQDWGAIGVIPMAVHLQMEEAFNDFCVDLRREKGLDFTGRMASAQEGSDWIETSYGALDDPLQVADLCLGRGFNYFFSKQFTKRYLDTGIFCSGAEQEVNDDFAGLGVRDPLGQYRVFSVVPAVLVVREEGLEDLAVPNTWQELLSETYRKTLVLPDCSTDLPRAVLLTLYSRYGEEGVRNLGRNIAQLLHPSQIVKKLRSKAADAPVLSILPYFFAEVVNLISGIRSVWLEDGTIIEPLFTVQKSSPEYFMSDPEAMAAAAGFFAGSRVASIFAKGNFPVLHPDIDNRLPQDKPLWWPGWDFIRQHDIEQLSSRLQSLYEAEIPNCKHGCRV